MMMKKSYVGTMIRNLKMQRTLNTNSHVHAIMIQTLMMTCVEYKDQFWCKYEMYYHIVWSLWSTNIFDFLVLRFKIAHLCAVN